MEIRQNRTLVVFSAQDGPLITRPLDQLPLSPAPGLIYNFDHAFYQQTHPSVVALGRAVAGERRNIDAMLREVLSALFEQHQVFDILTRRIINYGIADYAENGAAPAEGLIVTVTDRLPSGYEDLVFVQCKCIKCAIEFPKGNATSQRLAESSQGVSE